MRRSDLVQYHHDETRQYEFMSQINDYDNKDIEKLKSLCSIFATYAT